MCNKDPKKIDKAKKQGKHASSGSDSTSENNGEKKKLSHAALPRRVANPDEVLRKMAECKVIPVFTIDAYRHCSKN